jgi:hypothetical protein
MAFATLRPNQSTAKKRNPDSHARLNGLLNITNDKDLKCLV